MMAGAMMDKDKITAFLDWLAGIQMTAAKYRRAFGAGVLCCGFCILSSPVSAAGPEPVDPAQMPPLVVNKEKQAPLPDGYQLKFHEDFEKGKEIPFEPTDNAAWKIVEQDENRVYALTKRISDYKPPQRSPHNISLVKSLDAGSVVIDVQMQSAMTDYGHRSLCLFFNYEDPSHFYYVHFGKEADPHANQIFIVNGADRKAISETTTEGTPWDDNWHHARIIRDAETGKIAVYFDDMTKPAMTATDTNFTSGRVGIGSFDDAGNFDNLKVYTK